MRECRRTGGPLPGPGRSGGPGGPRGCVFGFGFYFIFQGLERGGERKKRRSERASACDVLLLTRFHPRPAGFNCACFPPRDRVQRPSSLHSLGMRESESRTVVSQGSRRNGENRVACGSTLRERGCEGKKRASKHEQHRPEARWISPSPHSRLQPPCRPGVSVETVILHCRKGSESDWGRRGGGKRMLERFSDETTLRRATTDDSVTRATRAPPPPAARALLRPSARTGVHRVKKASPARLEKAEKEKRK